MTGWILAATLVGCGSLEDLRPVPQENVIAVEAEAPPVEDGTVPAHEAQMGEPIADGGLREPDPSGSPDAVPPEEWNPISVPLGPREGTGVRWKGVKGSADDGPLPTANELAERFGADKVDPDQPWNRETVDRIIRENTK